MISNTIQTVEETQERQYDDSLLHIICLCDEDHALCSTEVCSEIITGDVSEEEQCIVCNDIFEYTNGYCPKCGADLCDQAETN